MDESPGLSQEYRTASPWPVFVAFGLVISELGVLLGIIPLATGGLLLFVGSIAGIVTEAGYAERPWTVGGVLGVVLVVIGTLLVLGQADPLSVQGILDVLATAFTPQPNGIAVRGLTIIAAGVIATGGALVGELLDRQDAAIDAI